jgi:hypothetical protein
MKDFFKDFEISLKCDKERLNKIEYYNTMLPYFTRDFFERVANIRFCFCHGLISHNDFEILEFTIKEIKELLNKKLIDRIKWHGERLDEHLKDASSALILVNGYNDLFTTMEFTL